MVQSICHCLPLLATLRALDCMEDWILQLDMLKGQKSKEGFGVWRENGAHEGGTVLTLCLDTLNNVISDSVGLWVNQSFCYWISEGDYSSQTFDISQPSNSSPMSLPFSHNAWTCLEGNWSPLYFPLGILDINSSIYTESCFLTQMWK